jgi:sulfonate transport system ATP-binding protein
MSETEKVVLLRGAGKSYGSLRVLEDLDFSLARGEFACIIGRSGCGKSTLLRLIAGLEQASAGEVRASGPLAMSFQEPRLVPWLRTWKNVCLGMSFPTRKQRREAAREALEAVALGEKTGAWPLTLSGGQAQRVSLARALIRKPRLLLLDEPFGALDAFTRREMQDLLAALVREHSFSVIMVTHDTDEAKRLADRVLVLEGGKLRENGIDRFD